MENEQKKTALRIIFEDYLNTLLQEIENGIEQRKYVIFLLTEQKAQFTHYQHAERESITETIEKEKILLQQLEAIKTKIEAI